MGCLVLMSASRAPGRRQAARVRPFRRLRSDTDNFVKAMDKVTNYAINLPDGVCVWRRLRYCGGVEARFRNGIRLDSAQAA